MRPGMEGWVPTFHRKPSQTPSTGTQSDREMPVPLVFAQELRFNEKYMSVAAAFAITCDQFGVTHDEGYALEAEASLGGPETLRNLAR